LLRLQRFHNFISFESPELYSIVKTAVSLLAVRQNYPLLVCV
jgi:hypothetical protein